jgi:hypothetical protein
MALERADIEADMPIIRSTERGIDYDPTLKPADEVENKSYELGSTRPRSVSLCM